MPRVTTHHVRTDRIATHDVAQSATGNTITEADALRIAVKAIEIYAARHPRPPHVTITQAAQMLGRSRPTVSKILTHNRVRLNALGMIPIEEIDKLLRTMS